jgi:Keratin-associated matrix
MQNARLLQIPSQTSPNHLFRHAGSDLIHVGGASTSRRSMKHSKLGFKNMFRNRKWMIVPVVALVLTIGADLPKAKADNFGFSFGSGYGSSCNSGYGYQSYRPSYGYGSGFGGYGYSGYRSNVVIVPPHQSHYQGGHSSHYRGGHYDYHPTEIYRHGNHYDVVPGHYDYHRGSHHGHH